VTDFLLEFLSEEIPARMQARGGEDLLALLLSGLVDIKPATARAFFTPRRVALVLEGLPDRQADRTIELRGPRVGAPEAALAGFLRSAGLDHIDQCEIRDSGKGSFYFAVKHEPGQTIDALLAGLIPDMLSRMVWPKSMRWAGYGVRWVRPLQSVLAVLYDKSGSRVVPARWRLDRGEGEPVWLEAGDTTEGHRFLAPERFAVANCDSYQSVLRQRFVILDVAERKARIQEEGAALAAHHGLRVKEDPGLLDEVAGLVEWPVVRLGRIRPDFMALPAEVLTTSMRTHQKYFACETESGEIAPFFVVVGNTETIDGGVQFVAGNERVLRARLSDAQFFWDQDRKATLESRVGRLKERVFHAKLGTVHDKVERMAALAASLVPLVPGAVLADAQRAVTLAKADLSSALVGEFPELQGVMGRYLALHDGETPEIAQAIAGHYAPAGASDAVPTAPLDIVVALADRLDTLAGFFAIGETPTGSKDPYALRRAALGVIRIVLDNGLRLPLASLFGEALTALALPVDRDAVIASLLAFFADRLKVALRDEGVRHDLLEAVFALGGEDDLVRLVARTRALQAFLATEDGANLLTAYRRASKIVAIEEKKDGKSYRAPHDQGWIQGRAPEEVKLEEQLQSVSRDSDEKLAAEDFEGAMAALAQLRRPVDDFFEAVTVNVDIETLRENRLRLLAGIWQALDRVADFSKIEG